MPNNKKPDTGLKIFIYLLAAIAIIGTLLPILPFEEWYVRVMDFPRLQLLGTALLSLLLIIIFLNYSSVRNRIIIFILLALIIYQGTLILPYTPLASYEVLNLPSSQENKDQQISLLVSNVYMKNEQYDQLLREIENWQPDLVLTLETDRKWQKALSVLDAEYPYKVEVPLDNTYGMLLHSRLPLQNSKVLYLMEEDIPSISSRVRLPSGREIQLYAVHPRPPVPGESDDSRKRDAEIVLIGKLAKEEKLPVIVAGDFNDVAWSPTTDLFQEVSGLLDPRIGRGFYHTFNAKYPLLRWPLDHLFHSDDFKLLNISRLPATGSDHFPIYLKLQLDAMAPQQQEGKDPDKDTKKDAAETIEEGQSESDKM